MKQTIKTARYYNSNNVAVAIVAVVNYHDGELFDWAAYIGGSTRTFLEEHCVAKVVKCGCKLTVADAAHYFLRLPIEKYRQ